MKIIKKNQIIIFVIALMLITAGYLNYTTGSGGDLIATSGLADSEQIAGIGDAKLVNSNNIEEVNDLKDSKENDNQNKETSNTINNEIDTNETAMTSYTVNNSDNKDEYFTDSRLTRDTMYSQMIESYQKILDNTSISAEQKSISQTEIKKINDLKNSIMICENLIKTKGFDDVVIFVNGNSISVIIKTKTEDITGEQAAQIQNVVAREMNAQIENIHISSK